MPSRTLYASQSGVITTASSPLVGVFPIQSASCEITRNKQQVLAYGHLSGLGYAPTSHTTCKSTIKFYLESGSAYSDAFDAAFINALIQDSVMGDQTSIAVGPYGYSMSGILSSMTIEISRGSFGMVEMTFDGVGEPKLAESQDGTETVEAFDSYPTIRPIVGSDYTVSSSAGCTNSFRFTLNIENEVIPILEDEITGRQDQIQGAIIGKMPMKTSMVIEGYGLNLSGVDMSDNSVLTNAIDATYQIGNLGIRLPQPVVSSKSFNQAVGNVGASYTFTTEDTDAIFS